MTANTVDVLLQHTSMQFSDTHQAHQDDADKVFDIASRRNVWIATGTESGDTKRNHDLHDLLKVSAHDHYFDIFLQPHGEWVAFNKKFFEYFRSEYMGPFIPGTHGLTPAQGAHSPRGVTVGSAQPTKADLGTVSMGVAHYLTARSIVKSGSNLPLVKGIAAYGHKYGNKSGIAFFNADANMNDDRVDVFMGKPFTTIADELHKHPATHGISTHRGTAIDIIASYDPDGRVRGKSYEVYDDSDIKLHTDHFMLHALYSIRERG